MKQVDFIQLVEESKRGKQRSQNTLMNLFWDRIYFYILSKIHDKTEAEDITIRTFTKVFEKLKLYNEDFDFFTWVKAIAYNTMIDQLRKKEYNNISLDDTFNDIAIEADVPSPEQEYILKQNVRELKGEIYKLPPIYRRVIELRYLEDKAYREIAKELKISLSNVKVRLLRAKKLLIESISINGENL